MEPRSRRRKKNDRKETKFQSLARKPTGTCMDQQQPTLQSKKARKLAASSYDLLFALREQPRNTELEAKESEERAEQKKKKRLEVLIIQRVPKRCHLELPWSDTFCFAWAVLRRLRIWIFYSKTRRCRLFPLLKGRRCRLEEPWEAHLPTCIRDQHTVPDFLGRQHTTIRTTCNILEPYATQSGDTHGPWSLNTS